MNEILGGRPSVRPLAVIDSSANSDDEVEDEADSENENADEPTHPETVQPADRSVSPAVVVGSPLPSIRSPSPASSVNIRCPSPASSVSSGTPLSPLDLPLSTQDTSAYSATFTAMSCWTTTSQKRKNKMEAALDVFAKKMSDVVEKDNEVLLQMQAAQHKHDMSMMTFLAQLIKDGQSQPPAPQHGHTPPVPPSQHPTLSTRSITATATLLSAHSSSIVT
ncbi:uncharacterized protein LOC130128353 [Lampris incognitus]|uniref:uncharacterized protein LOC130128353 n=1 Tax=Lampris incognitus TaxID=2546036 RepID=UPI0024B505AF|nr:uncharacterized protein LOC130128353 [Lampris incognitus]